jgi:hypothetical protein
MPVPPPAFTPAQWQALHALHTRYQQDRDLFSARERARLRFLRWLYRMGRLVP